MDSTTQLGFLVFMVLVVVGLLAMRRRMLSKMAVRNIARRKTYSAIVAAGLMIATAMIAASLTVGDTLDYVIKKDTFDSTGNIDIVVSVPDASGVYTYFNQSIAEDLASSIDAGSQPSMDAALPVVVERVTTLDSRTSLPYPGALLIGINPGKALNPMTDENGKAITDTNLRNGSLAINRALADEINAKPGDTLMVITKQGLNVPLTVSTIASDTGMGRWQNEKIVFMDLAFAQTMYNEAGKVNVIDVSCAGSAQVGYKQTPQAVTALEAYLPSSYDWDYWTIKEDGVKNAQTSADAVSQIFVIMSSFAIIAGVALITNIFVMLAEERKPEMGISRAIGMQRGDLTQSFMFEGSIYALLASALGAGVGLIVADVMVVLFASVFAGEGISFTFHFEWTSIAIAAFAGFLITMVTVVIASWRVSKLNIVRAIRDIPEPVSVRGESRAVLLGIGGVVLGALITIGGYQTLSLAAVVAGPCILALGGALLAARQMKPRLPFTIASLFMLWWVLDPFNIKDPMGNLKGSMEMFIVAGVLLVAGGVILVMFNSDWLLTGLVTGLSRNKSSMPVLRVAMSYPLNKKFRTGLTLFIFALIMFTVIVISMMASFERESVTTTTENFSGGFQIIGFSFRPIDHSNLTSHLENLNQTFEQGAVQRAEAARTASITVVPPGSNSTKSYSMVGLSDSMLMDNKLPLSRRSADFATDLDAWHALAQPNSTYAIIDGTAVPISYGPSFGGFPISVDQQLEVISATGEHRNFTVIGIMSQMMITGVFVSNETTASFAAGSQQNLYYFAIAPHLQHSEDELTKALEAEFVQYGLVTYSIRDTVKMVFSMISSIMQLFEVFLGVGLIVGITGLGIITIRNVAERRQEIGVMRAIGYQREMILRTFLLETSFVALLGIILGVALGLALSRELYDFGGFSASAPFVIPWLEIVAIVAIAFIATLASTLPPSRRAAKLAPAEALRRVD